MKKKLVIKTKREANRRNVFTIRSGKFYNYNLDLERKQKAEGRGNRWESQ